MDLLEALIRSAALRIAPPGEVFWYTSGTVGPYYINTHYLFGGPECAEDLLRLIDAEARSPGFHARLRERVHERLAADPDYRGVVEALATQIEGSEAGGACDWVSGGERRDWFFSLAVAERLGRPHLYLYKDRTALLAEGDRTGAAEGLEGVRTAHVADLVTEASSYLRAWIPAIRGRGGDMAISANVVDRAQGGLEALGAAGVEARALLRVDEDLFADLFRRGLIDAVQHAVLVDYFRDPTGAMRRFLTEHPGFVEQALRGEDGKAASRARLLVENDPYGLRQA